MLILRGITGHSPSERKWLVLIIVAAVIVRLMFLLLSVPTLAGGDVLWYFDYGSQLIRNIAPPVPSGPVFLLYVGFIQLFIPNVETAITVTRLLNIAWHVLLIVSVYALGMRYFDLKVSRLAVLLVAFSPVFIIECSMPVTESLFMGLLFFSLALYAVNQDRLSFGTMALVGGLLGVATLTRAVLLLFPVVLLAQLLRLHGWRQAAKYGAVLLITYGLIVSTWTVYNVLRWDRFVIGAEGLQGFVWMGAYGQLSPQQADETLGVTPEDHDRNARFLQQFLDTLINDLPNYLKTRIVDLASAYLQPHNTTYFPGESIKVSLTTWFAQDKSLSGLFALTTTEAFWPKLALYIVHFLVLGFGFAGLGLYWRRFWVLAPLYGLVLYISAAHAVFLALPRYLFPMMPMLILFGAGALVAIARAWDNRRTKHQIAQTA